MALGVIEFLKSLDIVELDPPLFHIKTIQYQWFKHLQRTQNYEM